MKRQLPKPEAGIETDAVTPVSVPAFVRSAGAFAGRFRWVICGLLFLGVTKNYMDRQVLGVLKTPLQHEFGWNEIDYGNVVFAFQTAYALGMIFVGRWVDLLGTRLGYAAAMVFWSIASMAHAVAGSLAGFGAARAALGFGEAGVVAAAIAGFCSSRHARARVSASPRAASGREARKAPRKVLRSSRR